jgi:molybdopterin-containing oxidoreductase family molybdopterin binding subunit
MKVVVVDPVMSTAAAKADEWIPIRPGTDAALALAMINVLLNEVGIYDAVFIKKYTNGPYLIGPDGHYLKDKATNKPLIWDTIKGEAKTYDNPGIKDFALEGSYKVNGTNGSPAFQLLKEHVKKYTPEEVSEITTIPPQTIRRIAKDFGEAARIGSTIVIEGKEIPYRPACAHHRKGPTQHKHSLLTCFAIQLLNHVIGNVGMPGGCVSVDPVLLPNKFANFSWSYSASSDGMLVAGGRLIKAKTSPYPPPEAMPPENVFLRELTPMAIVAEAMGLLNILNPEQFKFPYKPEVLFQSRTNIMMTTGNPEQRAEWFRKFDLVVSFAVEIDETAEMADIVLPDSHFLEKLETGVSGESEQGPVGLANDWCFQIRQPVVEPPPGVRNWNEVLMEIAERVGFLGDIYHMLNLFYDMKKPYKLDINKKYTWEEICERLTISEFSPEHDLTWFKEHGFIKWPKRVVEVYPTQFIQARRPVYLEHIIKVGEGVKRVTEEMGINWWDISDYQPLPDWKPCPAYEEKVPGYDLYVVNYKVPFHTFSITGNNMWLNEIGEYHPSAYNILINSQTAKRKGIKDGNLVSLETKAGDRVAGRIKVTEGIHPEVLGVAGCFGHWSVGQSTAKGKGVHINTLLRASLETIDVVTQAMDTCVKVKISKIS